MTSRLIFNWQQHLIAGSVLIAAMSTSVSAAQFRSEGIGPDDPIIALGEENAGRNHFFINNDEDVEVIRFKSPRDVEICAGAPKKRRDGRVTQYPIKVTWDTQTSVVQAGNCLSFDAQRVTVRAASSLPEDIVLEGSYRVSK